LASGHATYLYCLLRRSRAPDLSRAPAELPGLGRPRALDAGKGLWLIAADAPLDQALEIFPAFCVIFDEQNSHAEEMRSSVTGATERIARS